MADRVGGWVDPVMRAGYAGRGVVYVLVGILAVLAAWTGGDAEGTRGALATLAGKAWGGAVLVLVTIGLFAYAAWRLVDAAMDLDAKGSGAKGWIGRIGMAISALTHVALGLYAFSLVFRSYDGPGSASGSGGGSGSTDGMTATLLAQPFGRWIVGIVGAVIIATGVTFGVKALRERYKEHLALSRTTERLDPVLKFGLIAHGVVIAIVGGFFLWAAWTYDPSKAGGIDEAFQTIRASPRGQIALGIVGLGLVAFAVYCFAEAIWRIIPRRAGPDTRTLASRGVEAARQVGQSVRRATS